jgi:hypothetical protein
MTRFLLAINIALAVVAAKLSLQMQKTQVDSSIEWPLAPDPPANAEEVAALGSAAGPVPQKEGAIIPEYNLFDPARRLPDPDAIPVEEEEETTQENVDNHFELVSIGRLGRMACANIMAKTTITPPSRTSTRGQPPRAIADRLRAQAAARASKSSSSDGKAKVYKVGDVIGESGYRLLRISLRSVVLRDKRDTIVLTMNKGDETSKKRREMAHAAIEKKKTDSEKARLAAIRSKELDKAKAAAAAKRTGTTTKPPAETKKPEETKTTPPPPPPPPPPKSTPASSSSRSTGTTNKRASKIVQPRRTSN